MRRVLLIASFVIPVASLAGQVRVNPTGVSVADMSPTTVFLSYGGLRNKRPAEAYWCGELLTTADGVGSRCDPATIYGRLPARPIAARRSCALAAPRRASRRRLPCSCRPRPSTCRCANSGRSPLDST